ncbi:hypothetical protein CPB83DRAFT_884077 [Crepidotus variabilis]|uniref:Uncharacterized protein n=1 Tax=Crepidotus variabilis TaxID=179855 RepID=A0A9P6EF89_9AGAR|nr:hypothetical protein CPB83DRAFT_884077 [Crepidotus variabilis]
MSVPGESPQAAAESESQTELEESTKTCPLIVAQIALIGHPRRTEHWSIIALDSTTGQSRIFELAGNYDTFAFVPKSIPFSSRKPDYRGGFYVCEIEKEKLEEVEELLQSVPIIKHTPEYDSQNWVVLALRKLQEEGLVPRDVTENAIREELEKEKERWEIADDTLVERLENGEAS